MVLWQWGFTLGYKVLLCHLLAAATPTTATPTSMCVSKVTVGGGVHSVDGEFCPGIVTWLPAAIDSLQKYETIAREVGSVL